MSEEVFALRRALEQCREARDRLAGHGAFRTRVLLDMVLIELEQQEKAADRRSGDPSGDPKADRAPNSD